MRPEADISDFPTSGEPVETLDEARALIAGLQGENAELKARITDLEGAVEDLRRGNKRQSAPFSKGTPSDEPARPGRKKGKAHGRHGRDGSATAVESIHRVAAADEPTYNLNVEWTESYFVGALEVLVHNITWPWFFWLDRPGIATIF